VDAGVEDGGGTHGWKLGWKPWLETHVLLKNKKYRAYQISKYPHPYTLYAPPPKTTPYPPTWVITPCCFGDDPTLRGVPPMMLSGVK